MWTVVMIGYIIVYKWGLWLATCEGELRRLHWFGFTESRYSVPRLSLSFEAVPFKIIERIHT